MRARAKVRATEEEHGGDDNVGKEREVKENLVSNRTPACADDLPWSGDIIAPRAPAQAPYSFTSAAVSSLLSAVSWLLSAVSWLLLHFSPTTSSCSDHVLML